MTELIKKQIIESLSSFNLSEEEMKAIDKYVADMLRKYGPFIAAHQKLLESEEEIEVFKKEILKYIGDNNG